MNGPIINASGIVLGVFLALIVKKPLSTKYQSALKVGLGAFTVFFGLQLTCVSLYGSLSSAAKLFGIVMLSMILGKIVGKLLHLQKMSNQLGHFASAKIVTAEETEDKFNVGFLVCTSLFCAAPLAILGAVDEGLRGTSPFLIVKALMDGAAAMAFVSLFRWGVLLAALPVLALEEAIARGGILLEPWLRNQPFPLIESINATNGLLVFCVAMVILRLKKIEITDYLPSLLIAPVLTRFLW